MRLFVIGLVFSAGCLTGVRRVPRPESTGYRKLALAEVASVEDVNAELRGYFSSDEPEEVCDGVMKFTLTTADAAGKPGDKVAMTIPKPRYGEVRELKPFKAVRVRGYVSRFPADGCDRPNKQSPHYIWIDAFDPVPEDGSPLSP